MNERRAVYAERCTYSSEGGQWKRAEITVPRQRPTQRNVHHLRELTFLDRYHALLAALHTVFAGQPFYPASAWPATTPVHTQ